MEYFTNNDIKSEIVKGKRPEIITDVEYTLVSEEDPLYSVIDLYFIQNKTRLEHISKQKIEESDSYIYFQIPFEKRGYGIIQNSVVVNTNIVNHEIITDDGFGNLFSNDNKIGNIFYNSGVILLHDSELVVESLEMDIRYKRKSDFYKYNYYVRLNRNEYTNSSNSTFLDSDTPVPYITNISLLNEDNEVIKRASISKPVKTEEDILFILELFD